MAVISIILSNCAGGEDETSGSRNISNPVTQGNQTTTSGLPNCDDYTKGLDSDSDGLKDYDEFVGTPAAGTSVGYRTNPAVADTDGDGKSDALEVNGLRKVDGLAIENLLKNPVKTHPLHRDFIFLIHAQGGENSTRVYDNNNRNGWNIYNGIGTDPKTKFLRQPEDTELHIFGLPLNAIDRVALGADKNNWLPAKCQSPGNTDPDCTCFQGDPVANNQEGCTNFSGMKLSTNTRGPANGCDGNTFMCANSTFRNSIIARYNGSFPVNRFVNSAGYESFRVGSIGEINGSAGQTTTSGGGSVPVSYEGNLTWKLVLSTAQNDLHLMFRSQDTNQGTDDNSGFTAINARFINGDAAFLNLYAPFASDAEKATKLKTFYESAPYAGKCKLP